MAARTSAVAAWVDDRTSVSTLGAPGARPREQEAEHARQLAECHDPQQREGERRDAGLTGRDHPLLRHQGLHRSRGEEGRRADDLQVQAKTFMSPPPRWLWSPYQTRRRART